MQVVGKRLVVLCGLFPVALLVGGCGGSAESAAPKGPTVTVTGTDGMRFNPDTIAVKAGEPVTITFKNAGVIPHDFITNGAEKDVRMLNVGGGKTQSATFEGDKPGTYQVLCNQPGHKEAGMVAKIVVS